MLNLRLDDKTEPIIKTSKKRFDACISFYNNEVYSTTAKINNNIPGYTVINYYCKHCKYEGLSHIAFETVNLETGKRTYTITGV